MAKKLKLLFLSDGSSSHTINWVQSLIQKDIELFLFSLNYIDPQLEDIESDNFKHYSAKQSNGKKLELSKLSYLKSIPTLKKIIREFKPDIIHAHYATSYGLLAMLTAFPIIVTSVWGSDLMVFPRKSFLHRSILKSILKKSKRVFSTSKLMMEILENDFQIKDAQLISFGVDTNLFLAKKKENIAGFSFAVIKSLLETYGIDIAIRAFILLIKKYSDREVYFHIYGDGIKRGEYESLAGEWYGNQIQFHGKIPHNEVPEILNKTDVLVNISRSESFGVSILEASSTETAVIVSNRGGLTEVALNNETGLILKELNEKECMKAMETYLLDRTLANEHGKNGREFVLKNYDKEDQIIKQIKAYKKLLK